MGEIQQKGGARRLLERTDKVWSVYDLVAGMIACSIGLFLTPWHQYITFTGHWHLCLMYGVLLFVAARLLDVPSSRRGPAAGIYETAIFTGMAVVLAYMLLALVTVFTQYELIGRYVVAGTLISAWLLLLLPRLVAFYFLPRKPLPVVIFGRGRLAENLYQRLAGGRGGFAPVALWSAEDGEFHGLPVRGWTNADEAARGLDELGARLVVICADDSDPVAKPVQQLLYDLPLCGIQVINKGAFVENYFNEIPADYMSFHWTTSFFAFSASSQTFLLKRLLDIALSLFGLACTLPFYPLIALLIRLDSPGSIFFAQERVGYLGRSFRIYKFRTMRMDAEKNGAQWATKNDSRVTTLGRIFRKCRVDELPQLWNVLKGEMSVVGPRPERPEFVRSLLDEIPFYERRHLVPPGLTGWAQICYHYGASVDDARRKLQFDLYYVKHLTLLFDLKIILKTLPMIARGSR